MKLITVASSSIGFTAGCFLHAWVTGGSFEKAVEHSFFGVAGITLCYLNHAITEYLVNRK